MTSRTDNPLNVSEVLYALVILHAECSVYV